MRKEDKLKKNSDWNAAITVWSVGKWHYYLRFKTSLSFLHGFFAFLFAFLILICQWKALSVRSCVGELAPEADSRWCRIFVKIILPCSIAISCALTVLGGTGCGETRVSSANDVFVPLSPRNKRPKELEKWTYTSLVYGQREFSKEGLARKLIPRVAQPCIRWKCGVKKDGVGGGISLICARHQWATAELGNPPWLWETFKCNLVGSIHGLIAPFKRLG